jgi:DNA-binding GntR family transcriptional regulator
MEFASESHRAHELVAGQIRNAILNEKLHPGDRLVEDRLAEEFNVSRHPVREALRTLQLEGLVEISPRRGATVLRISPQDAAEMFEVLAALDGVAARLAAAACDTPTAAKISAVINEASAVLESNIGEYESADLQRLARLSREFHRLTALASGNRHLIDSITPLRDRVRSTRTAEAIRRPELSWREHGEVFDAIQNRDGDIAEKLARAHMDGVRIRHLEETARSESAGS